MTIKLYNTLTRAKAPFEPIDPGNVRLYVCGPTVYDYAHIGNARPIIVFDVLYRLLRHVYGAELVTYVRNITDVDDKINARAAEEGVSIRDVTERTVKQFHEDIASLGVLPPDVEPRATDHIEEMKALCETLVANGHAYVAQDHVLFDVPSMPDYGKLSNRTLDEMKAGARVEVESYKRDPSDFVLWKPSRDGEPAWPSPCKIPTSGRPGWHIECSAMADKWLWQEAKSKLSDKGLARPHVFDIHGGGIDLQFPHHENEIAQSRCAHGTAAMANVWMHNGFLQVEGEKMSKSLGNFITINELLNTTNFGDLPWTGDAVRLAMLMTHYRSPIDWTSNILAVAGNNLHTFHKLGILGLGYNDETDLSSERELAGLPPSPELVRFLSDDLNTPAAATTHLFRLVRAADQKDGVKAEPVRQLLRDCLFLGLDPFRFVREEHQKFTSRLLIESEDIDALITARAAARADKNWAEGDRIRDELAEMGVQLKDSKDPDTGEIRTTWEMKR